MFLSQLAIKDHYLPNQYFVYQLYFDNIRLEPFYGVQQQIWATLHFPFHLALVLLMEGTNQIFVWSHITKDLNDQLNKLIDIPENATIEQVFDVYNSTVNYVFNIFPATQEVVDKVQKALDDISPQSNITDVNQLKQDVVTLITKMGNAIFEGFG
jgi:hypothetical protein